MAAGAEQFFRHMVLSSRVLGFGAAAGYVVLYAAFLLVSSGAEGVGEGVYVVGAIMISLALVAALGALWESPLLLFGAFAASFYPVGYYFLGSPGAFFWLGVCGLLYPLAGALMLVGKLGTRSVRDSGNR
jgi:hypothetical protein